MADNYLEKREQELREARPKAVHVRPSLDSLLKRNCTYGGFDQTALPSREKLLEILEVTRFVGSSGNAQPLRYRLLTEDEARLLHPLVKQDAAAPGACIVICSIAPLGRDVYTDLGMAAQSILLKAAEHGLGGVLITDFDADAVSGALSLPFPPAGIIGLGKPAGQAFVVDASGERPLSLYRKNDVLFVPRLPVKDILI